MKSKQVNYFCNMIALVIADAVAVAVDDGEYCRLVFFFHSLKIRIWFLFSAIALLQITGFNRNEQKNKRNDVCVCVCVGKTQRCRGKKSGRFIDCVCMCVSVFAAKTMAGLKIRLSDIRSKFKYKISFWPLIGNK